ncbi:tellurite resistance TerB family protein [Advenella alkanexedens]|uniref:Tellurite resistance TerB family protein n=1 Tax=Advenella alkanexedens TaxID=1481665 RepID=A0ABS6NLM1_9BURK|nr:tellurite resistance TerB family protein [Advenella alkanexedens]MBV4396532.1 tellurite resistance TerB family protein [Advenella alkanexedens]
MSIQNVLQQLMQSAQGLMSEKNNSQAKPASSSGNSSSLKGFADGALTGGALALLMGNKAQPQQATSQPPAAPAPAQIAHQTQAFKQLPATELEQHSKLILSAMISAAKADGHINADEQRLLEAEFDRLNASPDEHAWIRAQINGPADPATVAKLVKTPEQAAEAYMASVLVNGADSFMERAYLDELARQLGLEESLKTHLENSALSPQR